MKYFNKQFHKGFTLAELMVCLALISIIATLMMPSITKLKPNKNKIMFKKAYSVAERTVSELIDDADLYPTGDEYQGFDNTTEVYSTAMAKNSGVTPPSSIGIPIKGFTCSGNGKFVCLFANQLDLGNSNSGIAVDYNFSGSLDGEPSFYTSDGVAWVLPITDFKPTSDYKAIYVDVNGKQNGPNCYDNDYTSTEIRAQSKIADGSSGSEPTYSSNTTKCDQPDRFKIYVRADGKMKVVGAAAKAYLGTTNLTGNKEKGSAD